MFASGNDTTGTPWPFFNDLNRVFNFTCDMAATLDNAKVTPYFGPDHIDPTRRDCLTVDWPTDGFNWLNPPYSDPEFACKTVCKKKLCMPHAVDCLPTCNKHRGHHVYEYRPGCIDFVRKAAEQRLLGVSTVLLLASRTDTAWWHEHIWTTEDRIGAKAHGPRQGVEIRHIRGRLKFEGHTQSAPFPSVLVIFKGV